MASMASTISRHGGDGAAALPRVAACMRGPSPGANDKGADTLARGHDLVAVAPGLDDEAVAVAACLVFDACREAGCPPPPRG